MHPNPIGAEDVAQYLRTHPEFFESHTELLASISVSHPHGGRAISLQERQLEVLRERHRALEMRLADLIRIGQENDAITDKLQRWSRQLLLAAEPASLAQVAIFMAFILLVSILSPRRMPPCHAYMQTKWARGVWATRLSGSNWYGCLVSNIQRQ